MSDPAAALVVSSHAVKRYRQRVLCQAEPCETMGEYLAIEAEILLAVRRCDLPSFPRYVVKHPDCQFVVVAGTIVTVLHVGVPAWLGVHNPSRKVELQHVE